MGPDEDRLHAICIQTGSSEAKEPQKSASRQLLQVCCSVYYQQKYAPDWTIAGASAVVDGRVWIGLVSGCKLVSIVRQAVTKHSERVLHTERRRRTGRSNLLE